MKVEANTPCCICGTDQSESVFERAYPEHGYPGLFAMRKCQGCGLLFNSPRLPDDQFPALYGRNYYFFYRSAKHEFSRILDVYRRTLALVQDVIAPRRVLEVGSAKGYLLALLNTFGWQVQGVEISPEASRYAEECFGVPTFTGTIEEYACSPDRERFPLVLAIDTLEHVLSPHAFLNGIDLVIRENGLLILDTPNGNALNISLKGALWKGFNPFHIFLFSPHNITMLLQAHGYSIERLFSYGNSLCSVQGHIVQRGVSLLRKWIINGLSTLHLANEFRILYQKTRQIFRSMENTQKCLTDAVNALAQTPSYDDVEDSKGELADRCQGDNMVITARKIQK
jgi:2-polyprenyl-3-methyl-5-hydroxy-6-metoxy-1,4-benzoquinol methylase